MKAPAKATRAAASSGKPAKSAMMKMAAPIMAGERQALGGAHGRESGQPHGIEPQEQLVARFQPMSGEEDENRDTGADEQIGWVLNPEDRHIQDQVAEGAAACAGHAGEEK